ncbi:MAG: dipicolinate synthase subunit DpsA [Bacillota bacterium]|nr:dipicolinate synthase subunit DpsA [Bacillota bacterium]
MKNKKFTVIGGDLRSCAAAESLINAGYNADTFLLEEASCLPCCIAAGTLPESDFYILGLPATTDGVFINAPLSSRFLSLEDFFNKIPASSYVFGGMVGSEIYSLADAKGIKIFDYYKREELQILNSIPTAEGAIEIAMREMPITLHGSRSLVIGYGRIGKVLAPDLEALGSIVTATSRSHEGRAWIKAAGLDAADTGDMCSALSEADVIFNTVPFKILTEKELSCLKKSALVIDLASKPGGVDLASAKALGVKVIWALSLPGKCAPLTAGRIISDTILNMLN